MSDLDERVCWTVSTAISTLSTEAVSPSTAVFLATHAPLRIRRRDPQLLEGVAGAVVTEEDVLQDFLNRSPGNGALLMPVIGESGTGKSHLVRWVHERTSRMPVDHRVIIHIPKASTSLRALVRILLERSDIHSEKLTQLRNQVDDLASGMDEKALQRHLLFALAEAITGAQPGSDPSRRALVSQGKLAEVLRDVTVGHHLTDDPGSLIPRLAASLLNDRGDGESDRPTQFTPEDLPHISDVSEAAQRVRSLLTLIMSRPELQTAAADLITENLSTAVQQVFKLGGRLQDAMLTIREEYQRQGKELVLLIEDFAVIQGLQQDLLEVLIEAGVRDGRQIYAPVRTLMAITSGYYLTLTKTVVTRIEAATPYVYDLDTDFDADTEGRRQTEDFVGRYLNAARIGVDRLEAAGVAYNAEVPNACVDCKFRDSCHEAFGVSPSGHGLFPFNWHALRRAIRSTPARGELDTFNPRRIIGRVIRPVLEDAEDLADRRFPGSRFQEQFPLARGEDPLSPFVAVEIEKLDAVDSARRTVMLEFWGGAPAEVINLASGIHEAFAIPELNVAGRRVLEQLDDEPPRLPPKKPNDHRANWTRSLQANVKSVLEWAAGREPLEQNAAMRIRQIVGTAVMSRCDWSTPLMAEPGADIKKTAWPNASSVVSIENAAGEAQSAGAPIRFVRNQHNAVFFEHLLTLQAKADAPGNESALPRLARLAELHQPDVIAAVLRVRSAEDDRLVAALRVSLMGAALAGRAWPGMKDTELVAAAFDEGITWELGDAAIRSDRWNTALTKHRSARPAMVADLRQLLGARQGTSGLNARILDAARIMPLIRQAAADWSIAKSEAVKWYRDANAPLTKFDELVEQQNSALRVISEQLSGWIPAGVNVSETLDAVNQAFKEAKATGLLPGGEDLVAGFPAKLKAVRGRNSQVIEQVRRDLERLENAEDNEWKRIQITTAVRDRGADLGSLMAFLKECDAWLQFGLEAAAKHAGGRGEDLAEQVRKVHTEWQQIVGDMTELEKSGE
ncbi:hypothetical protein Ais01nite_19520 [Asanoa ishikariensis]|uniref:Uncharacterized protein n=1 Tax=Asanoa ishikariensis TaxID=137265 RepID=A0A1H3UCD4_9ACTN|nr:protein DpdH [Asanoa ishikariensis]GIF63917.1 hypothetical protein Ais01nite_19520 [Asanoa ishikariensis]SDZ59701.1 hypothetical protein SAMN05421684_6923 [Asanoa ishikariensis]